MTQPGIEPQSPWLLANTSDDVSKITIDYNLNLFNNIFTNLIEKDMSSYINVDSNHLSNIS